ncbi:MAG: DUF3054 domain-containing protein [Actinomycetota bacterium]|nr:DUF3054 domain-containing protein [Actinomycetota bacterium]
MTTWTIRPTTVTLAAGVDVLAVLVFAAVGRSSHAEVVDAFGVLTTAAPFLLGLLVGWLVIRAWRAPLRLPVGVAVWAGVVVIGLGIRAAYTHRLPLTFMLIAAASLALLLLGWRAVARLIARSRGQSAAKGGAFNNALRLGVPPGRPGRRFHQR